MCTCPRCYYDLGNDVDWAPGECPVCKQPYTIESEGGETWSGDEYPVPVWPEYVAPLPVNQLAEAYNLFIDRLHDRYRKQLPGGNY